MKMQYIKTDKNGTKYYADNTCKRCGGVGGADQWAYTGWACYDCGGSGIAQKADIVKVYTPEYRAKLDAMAKAREEKRLAKRLERFNNERQQMIEDMGFDADGKMYVTYGNTFEIKDELKAEGAMWKFRHWCLNKPTDLVPYVIVDAENVLDIDAEYGNINWKRTSDVEGVINNLISKEPVDERESNFVGAIGDKLDMELTFVNRYSYENHFGYRTITNYIYSFVDDNGNAIVWNTTSWNEDLFVAYKDRKQIKVKVTGTIKDHSVYKDVKQTVLQRCKITC